jgi:hypothetical protein
MDLMREYPETWTDRDAAVAAAVVDLRHQVHDMADRLGGAYVSMTLSFEDDTQDGELVTLTYATGMDAEDDDD